jgi:hypothetical protein
MRRRIVRSGRSVVSRDALYAAYEAAANDPEYVAEMEEVTAVFDVTAGDGLENEPWEEPLVMSKRSPRRRTS